MSTYHPRINPKHISSLLTLPMEFLAWRISYALVLLASRSHFLILSTCREVLSIYRKAGSILFSETYILVFRTETDRPVVNFCFNFTSSLFDLLVIYDLASNLSHSPNFLPHRSSFNGGHSYLFLCVELKTKSDRTPQWACGCKWSIFILG